MSRTSPYLRKWKQNWSTKWDILKNRCAGQISCTFKKSLGHFRAADSCFRWSNRQNKEDFLLRFIVGCSVLELSQTLILSWTFIAAAHWRNHRDAHVYTKFQAASGFSRTRGFTYVFFIVCQLLCVWSRDEALSCLSDRCLGFVF